MNTNFPLRFRFLVLALAVLALALSACTDGGEDAASNRNEDAIFGNGFNDHSEVVARVGSHEITRSDLELRFKEFPQKMQNRYAGEDRDRRVLRYMVNEVLLVDGAVERELYQQPEISQHLISMRRDIMKRALTEFALLEGLEPSEEQVREYFKANRDDFMMQGLMYVRHVSCENKAAADEAYALLLEGGKEGHFEAVVAKYSTNEISARNHGELGWFNKGGFLPALTNHEVFTTEVWDLDIGLHPPMLVDGEWHIIEVTNRKHERRQTLDEARVAIVKKLLPSVQTRAVEDYLETALQTADIEYFGDFRPGQGRTDREIFESAFYTKDAYKKIDLYELLLSDFPQSELRDDAMLMIANVYLDDLNDRITGLNTLAKLVRMFPESELADDAQYLVEHNGVPPIAESDDSN